MYAYTEGFLFHITNFAKYLFPYRYLFVKTYNDILQKQDIYTMCLYHFCFGSPGEYREVAILAGYECQCISLIMNKLGRRKMTCTAYTGRM